MARAFTNFKQLLLKNLLIVSPNKSWQDCWQPVDPLEPSFEAIWLINYYYWSDWIFYTWLCVIWMYQTCFSLNQSNSSHLWLSVWYCPIFHWAMTCTSLSIFSEQHHPGKHKHDIQLWVDIPSVLISCIPQLHRRCAPDEALDHTQWLVCCSGCLQWKASLPEAGSNADSTW